MAPGEGVLSQGLKQVEQQSMGLSEERTFQTGNKSWSVLDPHLSHISKLSRPVKCREMVKTNKELKPTEPSNLP